MGQFDLHYKHGDVTELVKRLDPGQLRTLTFGAACAGFQCEGGYNGEGEPRNNWAGWEGRAGVVRSGGAARFWDRYGEDASLLATHGLHALRLSLEWARIEPAKNGTIDTAAVDHYARILAALRKTSVEPIATLYHWTHPAFLGADFWLDDDSPQRFATYLSAFLPLLLDALDRLHAEPPRRYITLNEPNMFALATYLAGRFPHRQQGGDAARKSLENQLLAHLKAVEILRRLYRERGLPAPAISFNNNFSAIYRMDALFVDLLVAKQAGIARDDLEEHLDAREKSLTRTMMESEGPIATSRQFLRWAVRSIEGWARNGLRSRNFPRLIDAAYAHEGPALDYLALDYYDPFPWNILGGSTPGNDRGFGPVVDEWDWKPHPRGLSAALSFYAEAAPGLPLWVAENGMATRAVGARVFPRGDGARRDIFIQAHIYEFLRALADGVPVQGYLHWSLWDNYEWGSYQPRFGLIGVDAVGGKVDRTPYDAAGAPALEALSAIARAAAGGDLNALAGALVARRPMNPERF